MPAQPKDRLYSTVRASSCTRLTIIFLSLVSVGILFPCIGLKGVRTDGFRRHFRTPPAGCALMFLLRFDTCLHHQILEILAHS